MPTEDTHLNDVIELLNFGAHRYVDRTDENGKLIRSLELDPKKIGYSTMLVNSQHLGTAIVKFLALEKLANEAKNFMTPKRAAIAQMDLMVRSENLHYGLNAKSSETQRDKDNNQSSLIHILRKEHVEREFKAKDPKSQKALASWLGQTNHDDA